MLPARLCPPFNHVTAVVLNFCFSFKIRVSLYSLELKVALP